MANIVGTNGNDTLVGSDLADTINGLTGGDRITGNQDNDTLTGGGGQDKFVYNLGDGTDAIADFGGVGIGKNPTSTVIAEVDTLIFQGAGLTARNLLLTQNGSNLEIGFEEVANTKVILQNFTLENLNNLRKSTGASVDLGNILFDGQTNIQDSFDVFNANSTQSTIFNKNTVTFLNDLNNNVSGFDNSDDVINGQGGDDYIDGKSGNDLLRGGDGNNTLNGGTGDDYLNVDLSKGANLLFGGDGNDTISASGNPYSYIDFLGNNTLNGGAGDDYLYAPYLRGNNLLSGGDGNDTLFASSFDNNDTLSGGSGKDKFVYVANSDFGTITITDFTGIGKGSNPSAAALASFDTLQFTGDSRLTARNLRLTQNGNNSEIFFEGTFGSKVVLENLALENLNNLAQVGNILFDGQTSIQDSFDVFDANSTQSTIFNKNTVTFLNDLNNNVNGFDKSDDVINGQRGNDRIDGKSGNDLLRGDAGSDTLIGGAGDDLVLDNSDSTGNNLLFGGDGNDSLSTSGSYDYSYFVGYYFYGYGTGNNTLNGGAGSDTLNASFSKGDNLLNGDDGDDYLYAYAAYDFETPFPYRTYGDNTLNGGTGKDTLNVDYSFGNNLLNGGDGNDSLSASGSLDYVYGGYAASGNNTLNGGTGNDTLNINYSTGDNLLDGGDGNDSLSASGYSYAGSYYSASGNNTLNGGAGNDTLNISYSQGDNLIFGGNGNDLLSATGAAGNNTLDGGNGNDTLTGGNGNDTLYGGNGTDTFVFNSYNQGVDSIYDFDATKEVIKVSTVGFGGNLSIGSLLASQFTLGTSATTIAQRFIYDNTTGALYFDQDGSAGGFTQVQFAQLSGGVSLTKNNFVVV
ncbi:calcium-binding protein [Nostoc sp. ChiQUE01b]|uniref:beta strand repeat-containing protein n=1 Tax=Nostoc sp. ChiQUE01b TaxID=3075376 RepID=UPI002AD276B2|nr:calcium-binding protein [Nostoc sp. ChiQUE01b]MDZ8259819.1 calcium-binding protein [Nostoc sp. ChiQUE01b]